MAVNETGLFYPIIQALTQYVIGNEIITCLGILVFLTIFAILVQIPLPFAIALNIPYSIVMTAWGFMPVLFAAILIMLFLIAAITSLYLGLGLNN